MDLDQVVFCWSEHSLLGTRGVGPVASSLPPDLLAVWNHRLGSDIWAADDPPGGPAGLSYLCYDQDAAIIHKLPVADQNDRPGATFTHVLVGPARFLTAQLALGLADWDGWQRDRAKLPADGQLDRLPAEVLRPSEPTLPDATLEQAAPLLWRVLAQPDQRFSVIAPTVPATGILRVLFDVLGDVGGVWTFATRESADAGPNGPRLIFLIGDPGFSAHGGRRIRIHPAAAELEQNPYADLVKALLEGYRRGGAELMARLRPGHVSAIAHWAQAVQVAPGVLADARWLMSQANRGEASPDECAFLSSARGRSFIAQALSTAADRDIEALLATWSWDRSEPASRVAGGELLQAGLLRCLRWTWPSPELLRGVQRARLDSGVLLAALRAQLASVPKEFAKHHRAYRRIRLIAAAMLIDPTLTPAEQELAQIVGNVPAAQILGYADQDRGVRQVLVRMVVETGQFRRRPDEALRFQVERHGYFALDLVARSGHKAVGALAVLLELAYGAGIARCADDVRHIAACLPKGADAPGDGQDDVDVATIAASAVLTAVALRTRSDSALLAVEHELALRVIRAFEPGYQSPAQRAAGPANYPAPGITSGTRGRFFGRWNWPE